MTNSSNPTQKPATPTAPAQGGQGTDQKAPAPAPTPGNPVPDTAGNPIIKNK